MFERELEFFKAHQDELVSKYRGQVLVIRGDEVVDAQPSALHAYLAASEKYEPGTFMLQSCEPGPTAYTVTIASSSVLAVSA